MRKSEEREDAPILIVEDDEDLRTVLSDLLREEGWAVIAVESLSAAHVALATVRPALVLLDLRLQGQSSEMLLAELSDMVNPQTTVVVSGSVEGASTAAEYGVLSVAKPFDIDALVATVRRAIAEGDALLATSSKRQGDRGGDE